MRMRARLAEAMFASAYGISAAHQIAFRRRVGHLRSYGCPGGLKTGSGRTAFYGWEQLVEQAVALDLIDAGVAPERAANLIGHEPFRLKGIVHTVVALDPDWRMCAINAVANDMWPAAQSSFLFVQLRILGALSTRDCEYEPAFELVRASDLLAWRHRALAVERSGVVLDFGSILATLIRQVADFQQITRSEMIEDFYNWVANLELDT
jgi:hypothetical protein